MTHLHLAKMQPSSILLKPAVNRSSSPTSGLRTQRHVHPESLHIKCEAQQSQPSLLLQRQTLVFSEGVKGFEFFGFEDKRQREQSFWGSF